MFKLFGNTYLDFDFLYSSIHENALASDKHIQDPFFKEVAGQAYFQEPRPFEVYLEEEHKDNWENFWTFLYEKGSTGKFFFYTSSDWYLKLLVRYWKSIFKNASPDFLYFLYRAHIQNLRLLSIFANKDLKGGRENYRDDSLMPTEKMFHSVFNSEAPSAFLSSLAIEERNYEYLLAGKLCGAEAKLSEAFERSLRSKAWKALGSEIEILRNDILGGIYDLFSQDRRREGEKEFNFKDYIDSFHVGIANDPKYAWVMDPYLCEGDPDHVLSNYNASLFKDFLKGHQQVFSDGDGSIGEDKFYRFIDLVFEERYSELLDLDIETGFGSMFFNGESRFEVNQLLISYIYDCFRRGQVDLLESFKVEGA